MAQRLTGGYQLRALLAIAPVRARPSAHFGFASTLRQNVWYPQVVIGHGRPTGLGFISFIVLFVFPELKVELKTKERLFGALLAKSNDEGLEQNQNFSRCCPQPITGSYQLRSVLTALRAVLGLRHILASRVRCAKTSGSRKSLYATREKKLKEYKSEKVY